MRFEERVLAFFKKAEQLFETMAYWNKNFEHLSAVQVKLLHKSME